MLITLNNPNIEVGLRLARAGRFLVVLGTH